MVHCTHMGAKAIIFNKFFSLFWCPASKEIPNRICQHNASTEIRAKEIIFNMFFIVVLIPGIQWVTLLLLLCWWNLVLKNGPSTTSKFVMEQTFLNTSLSKVTLYMFYPWHTFQGHTLSSLWKKECHFSTKRWSLLTFEIQFCMPLFLRLFKTTRKYFWTLKIKIDNPMFVNEEGIPMVHQDEEDYDD